MNKEKADNQAILSAAQASSKAVELLDVHSNGIVSAAQVERAIRKDTCLVTVMYANNEIGSIQPISEIGAVCREKGAIFHTDEVQAAGHLPIDVKAQNIDFLSLSAHKFHGPKGIGVLYARSVIPVTSVIKGGVYCSTKCAEIARRKRQRGYMRKRRLGS